MKKRNDQVVITLEDLEKSNEALRKLRFENKALKRVINQNHIPICRRYRNI